MENHYCITAQPSSISLKYYFHLGVFIIAIATSFFLIRGPEVCKSSKSIDICIQ